MPELGQTQRIAHLDLRVKAMVDTLDGLGLPEHDDQMLRDNLQEIIELNGTTNEVDRRYKRMLMTQTGVAISLHKQQARHVLDCTLNQMIIRDENGKIIKLPWQDDMEKLRQELTGEKDEGEESEVTLGWKKNDILKFKGPVAKIVGACFGLLVFLCSIIFAVKMNREQMTSIVNTALQQQARLDTHKTLGDSENKGAENGKN